jgi:cell division protein FtsL
MDSRKQVRAAVQTPVFEFPRVDLRRFGVHAVLFGFCLLSAMALTYSRLEITRLRYELNHLHQQRQTILGDVERLQVQARTLASPQRIEKLAKQAGFTFPDRDSVVLLDG